MRLIELRASSSLLLLVLEVGINEPIHAFGVEVHLIHVVAVEVLNPAGPLPNQAAADRLLDLWLNDWRNVGFGPWAVICRAACEATIGFGGLSRHAYGEVRRPNLGYRFAVEAWGRGYATELATASLKVAFTMHELAEVYGLVRPQHLASIRVLEKVGMPLVGTLDDGPPASLVYRATRPR